MQTFRDSVRRAATENFDVIDLIDAALDWLGPRGLELAIEPDIAGWAAHMRAAPATKGVNPTFDPRCSRVDRRNSFWVNVLARGETVACGAGRLFETDDYLELKRSLRLWFDREPVPHRGRLELIVPDATPFIAGRVGHEGGLWVHPAHRKRGLSMLVPRLVRAICLGRFAVEWQCGVNFDDLTRSGLPTGAYGFPHCVPCLDGFFPPTGRHERMHMVYMSRAELLSVQRDTVVRLRTDRDQQAVDAAASG
jgi:GNAT superfamily N-acetyltransferase